jgi:hypothetical protein
MASEVVLDHEELLEAQPVGLDHVFDETVVALAVLEAGSPLGPGASEQPELHDQLLICILPRKSRLPSGTPLLRRMS